MYAGMYPQQGPAQGEQAAPAGAAAYQQQLAAAVAMQQQLTAPQQQQAPAPPAAAEPPRFKTRMCAYAASGNCPYAARGRCFFAHSAEELRGGTRPAEAASKRKTKMCSYFLAGYCPYAATNSCLFAHSEQERQAAVGGAPEQQPQQPAYAATYADPTTLYNQWLMLQQQQFAAMQGGAPQQQYHQQMQTYMASYQQWMAAQAAQQQQQQARPVYAPPLPQPQPRPNSAFYKTRLCKFGDSCPYRQAGMCRFAHSTAELRTPEGRPPQQAPTEPEPPGAAQVDPPRREPRGAARSRDDDPATDHAPAQPAPKRPSPPSAFARAVARCARPIVMTYLHDLAPFLVVLAHFDDHDTDE